MKSNPVLKGSLVAIILKLLETNDRMYGYEITRAVRETTNGKMSITEAALYPALHKLVGEGLLTTETELVEGRMRKYYALTPKGKKQTIREVEMLKEMIASVRLILNTDKAHG